MKVFSGSIFKILATVLTLMIIYNLSLSVYDLWKRKDIITDKKKELILAEKENDRLKRKIEEAMGPEFIEKEARDKLGMSRPGDVVIVVDKKGKTTIKVQETEDYQGPKWKLWWRLFF